MKPLLTIYYLIKVNMIRKLIAVLVFLNAQMAFAESITGRDEPYLMICFKAATMPYYFQNFRSLPEYTHAVEISNGKPFAEYLLDQASDETWEKLGTFKRLESFGNPRTSYYPSLGNFSATTLRYILIADEINKLFKLPDGAKIVEIGAGFGGQSYILSQVASIDQYYIYDLPEPSALIEKVMGALGVNHVVCLPIDAELPEEGVDLFISNYSFSECDKDVQIDYFERVLKKSDRGYVLYNQTSHFYGLTSLSPIEFIQLLEKNGIHPKVLSETVPTFDSNLLIIWDKTL